MANETVLLLRSPINCLCCSILLFFLDKSVSQMNQFMHYKCNAAEPWYKRELSDCQTARQGSFKDRTIGHEDTSFGKGRWMAHSFGKHNHVFLCLLTSCLVSVLTLWNPLQSLSYKRLMIWYVDNFGRHVQTKRSGLNKEQKWSQYFAVWFCLVLSHWVTQQF